MFQLWEKDHTNSYCDVSITVERLAFTYLHLQLALFYFFYLKSQADLVVQLFGKGRNVGGFERRYVCTYMCTYNYATMPPTTSCPTPFLLQDSASHRVNLKSKNHRHAMIKGCTFIPFDFSSFENIYLPNYILHFFGLFKLSATLKYRYKLASGITSLSRVHVHLAGSSPYLVMERNTFLPTIDIYNLPRVHTTVTTASLLNMQGQYAVSTYTAPVLKLQPTRTSHLSMNTSHNLKVVQECVTSA